MKKGRATGLRQNDTTKDVNRAAFAKNMETVDINDAWRKAKANDPSIEFRMTFVEYRKLYRKGKAP